MGYGLTGVFRAVAFGAALLVMAAPASAQLLNEATWFERKVGDGITWRYYHFNSLFGAKQSVSYMEVDLGNPNVDLAINYRDSYVGPSPGISHPDFPRQLTSVMANEVSGAKAAINGTYFNTASYDPSNPTKAWGGGTTYLKASGTTVHTFDGTNINLYAMGILFNNKSDLTIMRKSGAWGNRNASWQNMMICGPVLLNNGVVEFYDSSNTHATARHPRSAVGKNTSQNKLIMLTVDGRTPEAAGMSCTELAQVMQALGCDFAVNLDGGGSTTLWAADEPFDGIVNYPSDNSTYDHLGQRRAANALIIKSASASKADYDARLTGLTYNTLTRSGEELPVTVTYENLGSQTWTSSNVKVVTSRSFGRTSPFIPAEQQDSFFTMSPASVAPGQTAQFTLNLVAPNVTSNRNYDEHFALWQSTQGYFGPADNELKVSTTVRPPLSGAPPLMVVQGTPDGPNNQWYEEGPSGWGNSSISFSASGVANSGTQRYCAAASTWNYADFKPVFDVRGVYRVEAAFPYSSNSINPVKYTVNHMFGSASINLNQNSSADANTWQLLGQFSFSDEMSDNIGVHSVRVTNGTTTGNRFYSGAIRFDYVGLLAGVDDWTLY